MKLLILFTLIGCSCAVAQDTPAATTKKTSKPAAKKKSTAAPAAAAPAVKTAQPLTVPKDAVANPDGSYSWTDTSGKKWIYNKTPFGVSKIEDTTGNAPSGFTAVPQEQIIQTTDQGDTVKFARQSPFGTTSWEKKKSDMTDDERALFQKQHPEKNQ